MKVYPRCHPGKPVRGGMQPLQAPDHMVLIGALHFVEEGRHLGGTHAIPAAVRRARHHRRSRGPTLWHRLAILAASTLEASRRPANASFLECAAGVGREGVNRPPVQAFGVRKLMLRRYRPCAARGAYTRPAGGRSSAWGAVSAGAGRDREWRGGSHEAPTRATSSPNRGSATGSRADRRRTAGRPAPGTGRRCRPGSGTARRGRGGGPAPGRRRRRRPSGRSPRHRPRRRSGRPP